MTSRPAAPRPRAASAPRRRRRSRSRSRSAGRSAPTRAPATDRPGAHARRPLGASPSGSEASAATSATAIALVPSDPDANDADDDEDAAGPAASVLAGMAAAPASAAAWSRGLGDSSRVGVHGRAWRDLAFWAWACTFSKHRTALQLMVTRKATTVAAAAVETVANQFTSRAAASRLQPHSPVLSVSRENAVASARLVAGLVRVSPQQAPQVVLWSARAARDAQRVQLRLGLVRSFDDAAHTVLNACYAAKRGLRPDFGRNPHVVPVWSVAQRLLTPTDEASTLVPGLVEAERYGAALDAAHLEGRDSRELGFNSRERMSAAAARLSGQRSAACREGSVRLSNTGVARGAVVFRARLVMNNTQQAAAARVAAQLRRTLERAQERPNAGSLLPISAARLLRHEPLDTHVEPVVTPGNNLVLGIEADAAIRRTVPTKARRGDPCCRLCGPAVYEELLGINSGPAPGDAKPAPPPASAARGRQRDEQRHSHTTFDYERPFALLPIIDMKLTMLDREAQAVPIPSRAADAVLRRAAVELVVAGDSPVRVVDLAANLATVRLEMQLRSRMHADPDPTAARVAAEQTARVRLQTRALSSPPPARPS